MSRHSNQGFTLIDVLITVVVVVVLASVAVPSYQKQIQKSRRADAMQALNSVQLAEEKYRASDTAYSSSLTTLGFASSPFTSGDGYYSIALSGTSATGYTVTANAVSGTSQATDSGCTSIVLNVSGGTISQTPTACWNR